MILHRILKNREIYCYISTHLTLHTIFIPEIEQQADNELSQNDETQSYILDNASVIL